MLSRNTTSVVIKAVGCKLRDAVEFIAGAVKTIGAGDCSDVHNAARGASVFCREISGNNAKLLNRIKRDRLTYGRGKVVDVLHAVEKDARAGRTHAVNCVAGTAASTIRIDIP